jgi:2-amino-4-hydroxy-6-hydroxymethyldihydropteridine diphosphokinase
MAREASPEKTFDATIGLGSNVGDKAANIDAAIERLTKDGAVRLVGISRKFRSAPWGVTEQDWFVNACISVATDLSAPALLQRCLAVEDEMGRKRQQKWGPRIIDVDVLTFRDEDIKTDDLVVPHPYIAERAFVLLPLKDVAPALTIAGKSLDQMITALNDPNTFPLAE